IPILGHLFRDETRKKVKTNLLLFLTPYIIKDKSDFRRIFEKKMKERQQFIELFYGQVPGYDVAIDFDRKAGPVAKVAQVIRLEERKAENGGPGLPGERGITPAPPGRGPLPADSPPPEPRGEILQPESQPAPTPFPTPSAPNAPQMAEEQTEAPAADSKGQREQPAEVLDTKPQPEKP